MAAGFIIASFALAFAQRPGWATSDTKIDLHVDPGAFLGQVASIWTHSIDLGAVHGAQYSGSSAYRQNTQGDGVTARASEYAEQTSDAVVRFVGDFRAADRDERLLQQLLQEGLPGVDGVESGHEPRILGGGLGARAHPSGGGLTRRG